MSHSNLPVCHFGNTGFQATRIGLGAGGHSRLGQSYGNSVKESIGVVRAAIDAGINTLDTAVCYDTEEIIGKAVKDGGNRDNLFISTKIPTWTEFSEDYVEKEIEKCLRRLKTDRIDLIYLHGVPRNRYRKVCDIALPVLGRARETGKIRFIGVTEGFASDTDHSMLQLAIRDDFWDAIMVGMNLLNPSARETVLPTTMEKKIGVHIMFAVRRALSQPDAMKKLCQELIDKELLPDTVNSANPLQFVLDSGEVSSIPEAAYRYLLDEPGVEVILSGTGRIAHLMENIKFICRGPLSPNLRSKISTLFGHIDSISGN